MESPARDLEVLLTYDGFVRGLAASLVADGHHAEDVAQQAWLSALQHEPRDRGRLRAWLAALVRNFAAKRARSESSRARTERAAARGEALPSAGEILEREAARRSVVEAVVALDEPYQSTILLRYFEHLPPREIARRLAIPVGTVHSRCKRALEQLRGKLDREHGGDRRGWSAILLPLAKLPPSLPVAAPALTALGGLAPGVLIVSTASKLSLAAVVLACASLALWQLAGPPEPKPPVVESRVAGTATAAANLPAEPVAAAPRAPAPAPERSEPAADLRDPAARALPLKCVIRGRCVARESGQPLSGCAVRLEGSPRFGKDADRKDADTWKRPSPVTTAGDGFFALDFERPSDGLQILFEIRAPDRLSRNAHWSPLPAKDTIDLGDIVLEGGATVRGRIVDAEGSGVAGVLVGLRDLPMPLFPAPGLVSGVFGRSDPQGMFVLSNPIPAGRWPVELQQAFMCNLVGPTRVEVPPGLALVEVLVTVTLLPSISGVLVDDTGTAVAGMTLALKGPKVWTSMLSTTQGDGSFTQFPRTEDRDPVQIVTSGDPGPYEPLRDERRFAWGTKDVRLVTRKALTARVEVVEAGSGKPIEHYGVRTLCRALGSTWESVPANVFFGNGELRLMGAHPEGALAVDRIPRGRNRLQVIPKEARFLPSAVVEFDAQEAPEPSLRVELEPLVARHVQVLDQTKAPVAGANVELIVPGFWPVTADSGANDDRVTAGSIWANPKIYTGPPVPGGGGPGQEMTATSLLSAATTAADGKAEVFAPRQPTKLALRVRAPALLPLVMQDVELPEPGGTLVVSVSTRPRTKLSGRLVPAGILAGHPSVQLRAASGSSPANEPDRFVTVDPEGRFVIEALPPGAWTIRLLLSMPLQLPGMGPGRGASPPMNPPLATVDLREGKPEDLELDASGFVPCSISGKVLLDGEPAPKARVQLEGSAGGVTWRAGLFATDENGRFEIGELPPGRYGLVLETATGRAFRSTEGLSAGPGTRNEATFACGSRGFALRLLDQMFRPVKNAVCNVTIGGEAPLSLTTDEHGWLTLERRPVLPVRVAVSNPSLEGEVNPAAAEKTDLMLRPVRR